ncbi:hypothetical protein NDNC_0850 [Candidatus Nasuia deltocephalinicola]|uniref:G domain-containing protein n=1 Tax=Candidatus Nasuia deltocephalincola TaxID=1160784 RepID=A0A975A341_9PROT|nr:hypothetical protein CU086_00155 [Candidatus Nasuia deltocephalinicola]WKD87146.1 50S ribosome-binding GTPase [Candidatus Nasuia deltocephalinicola]BEH03919.1 hypothetical protein NDNC_0850 [Candidatus Nasuia deltocephalinicola]
MIPVISILGKFNVGKSSFFNKLSNCENNLSFNFKYLTLYKIYIFKIINNFNFLLFDTAYSIFLKNKKFFFNIKSSINDSDIIIFFFDNLYGILYEDKIISLFLKKIKKYIFLILNKIDFLKFNINVFLYFKFGFGKPYIISSSNNFNLFYIISSLLNIFCFFKNCFYFKKLINKFKIFILGYFFDIKKFINYFFNKKKIFFKYRDIINFDFFFNKIKISIIIFLLFFNNYKKIFTKKKIKKISILKFLKSIIICDLFILIIHPYYIFNILFINFAVKVFKSLIFFLNVSNLFLNLKIYFKNFFFKKYKIFNFYIISIDFYKNFFYYFFYYIYKIFNLLYISFNYSYLSEFVLNFNNFLLFNNKNFKIKLFYLQQKSKNPPAIKIFSNLKIINSFIKFFIKKKLIKFLKLKSIFLKILF